jgi:hypothetical protein
MVLSTEDLSLLIKALDMLDLEYGRPGAAALAERLRAERDTRPGEIEAAAR